MSPRLPAVVAIVGLLVGVLALSGCDGGGGKPAPVVAPVKATPSTVVSVPTIPADLDWNPDDLTVLSGDVVAQPGSGTSRLSGVVLDPEGNPVAGAEVQVLAVPTATLAGFEPVVHATAVSGEDGRFEVGPGPDPWEAIGMLSATAPGFARTSLRSRAVVNRGIPSADPGAPVTVRLIRGHRVRGRVRTPAGRPPDGPVRVWAIGEGGTFQDRVTTDSGGAFSFLAPADRVVVQCVAGVHPESQQVIDVTPDGENEVQFVLAEGRDIAGQVVDAETGEPVRGAVLRTYYGQTTVVRADDEGRFVVPRYWFHAFQVRAPGYAERVHQLAVDAGRPGTPPEKVRMLPGIVARGRVVDLQGNPVEGARLWCYAASRAGELVDISGPLSRADGTFTFVGLPVPGEGKEIRVFSRMPGYGEGNSEAVTGVARSLVEGVEVRMPRLVRLQGVVLDEKERPWRALLDIAWKFGPELAPYQRIIGKSTRAFADEEGRWSAMVPERSNLVARVQGAAFRAMETEFPSPPWRDAKDPTPAPEPVVVRVFHGLVLRGRAVDSSGKPARWGEVRVEPNPPGDGRPPSDALIGPDGVFEAPGLEPGRYDISVLVQPEFLQEVVRDLEAGGDPVEVRLRRAGGLQGRLVLPGPLPAGTLPRISLRALGETRPLGSRFDREVTSADLRFEIGPLAPTEYSLTVTAGPWRRDYPRLRVVEREPTDLGDVVLEDGCVLGGTVTCDGEPVKDAELELFLRKEGNTLLRAGEAVSGDDGTYLARGLPPGEVLIVVRARDLPVTEATVRLEAGPPATCDVPLPRGASLRILTVDGDDRPLPGVRVLISGAAGSILYWDRNSPRLEPHASSGEGVLEATGLPVGTLRVHAELPGKGVGGGEVETVAGEIREIRVKVVAGKE